MRNQKKGKRQKSKGKRKELCQSKFAYYLRVSAFLIFAFCLLPFDF